MFTKSSGFFNCKLPVHILYPFPNSVISLFLMMCGGFFKILLNSAFNENSLCLHLDTAEMGQCLPQVTIREKFRFTIVIHLPCMSDPMELDFPWLEFSMPQKWWLISVPIHPHHWTTSFNYHSVGISTHPSECNTDVWETLVHFAISKMFKFKPQNYT